jgi:hypothetical protein
MITDQCMAHNIAMGKFRFGVMHRWKKVSAQIFFVELLDCIWNDVHVPVYIPRLKSSRPLLGNWFSESTIS